MAATFTVTMVKVFSLGDRKGVVADIVATGTPTAGGDVLSPTALGLELELNAVIPLGNAFDSAQTSGAGLQWDPTDNKISYQTAAATPATGTLLTAYTGNTTGAPNFRILAIGKGQAGKASI